MSPSGRDSLRAARCSFCSRRSPCNFSTRPAPVPLRAADFFFSHSSRVSDRRPSRPADAVSDLSRRPQISSSVSFAKTWKRRFTSSGPQSRILAARASFLARSRDAEEIERMASSRSETDFSGVSCPSTNSKISSGAFERSPGEDEMASRRFCAESFVSPDIFRSEPRSSPCGWSLRFFRAARALSLRLSSSESRRRARWTLQVGGGAVMGLFARVARRISREGPASPPDLMAVSSSSPSAGCPPSCASSGFSLPGVASFFRPSGAERQPGLHSTRGGATVSSWRFAGSRGSLPA